MNTRDEKYSVLCLDLPGGVLPNPKGSGFTHSDLMQAARKARHFYGENVVGAVAPTAGESFIPVIRRRRR